MRWLIAIALGLGLVTGTAVAQAPRNVVLIIADDFGLDLACYGNKVLRTPSLDGLVQKGVVFTRAYATVSSCSPSRASIFTGLYSHQNGMYGLQHAAHNQQSYPWVQSLPSWLRAAGFWTGLIGKFHVGPAAVFNFDSVANQGTKGNRDPVGMAKLARAFIKQSDKRPFFLVCAFSDPHRAAKGFANEQFANDPGEIRYDSKDVIVPYHLPDAPEVRQDLAEYYQSSSRMDRGVGKLLEVLRELGHLEDTLIIFISDNGIPFPGAKTTLYSAGIHLPLLMVGPGLPKEKTNDTLVSFIDLAPTILDWTKAKGPSYKLPGKSLLPIVDQQQAKGWDAVFASHQFHEITMYYPMRAITTSKSKYILNLAPELEFPLASDLWDSPSWQGIRKRGDKMMGQLSVANFLHRPKEELFDLTTDPLELHNLANEPAQAAALAQLRQQVRQWQRATSDPWLILNREGGTAKNP